MKTNLEKKMIYLIPVLNVLQLIAMAVILFCTDSFNPAAKTIMALVMVALGVMFVLTCLWLSNGSQPASCSEEEAPIDLAA